MTEAEKARLRADIRRRRAKAQSDGMGFPAQPTGGVSTNTQAVNEFSDKATAAALGARKGITLGQYPRLKGVYDAFTGPDGQMLQNYQGGRDAAIQQGQEAQAANPVAYGGGDVVGTLGPAIASAPLATGKTLLGTMARGMGLGAGEGFARGTELVDGEFSADRMKRNALIGAGVGVAAPLAVAGASAVKNAVKDPVTGVVDSVFNRANAGKANRAISKTLRKSGKTQQEIADMVSGARAVGQPEFTMMDALGQPGQRMASGIVRGGGDASTEIAEYLSQRQLAQPERVASFVDDAFMGGNRSAAQTVDDLTKARSAAANTAYDAARGNAAPVDVRGALSVIDDRIGGMQGSNVAGDAIDGKLSGYRSRLAADPAPDGEIARELSDFDRVLGVKQSVQDDIGAAVRAGRNNEARELGKLVKALDEALESSSDMYRAANDGFREASGVIGAVDEGAAMSRPSQRATDTTVRFGSMTPDQQSAARVGYGDDLLRRIENATAPTANRAKVLQSPKRDVEAGAMSIDPDLYRKRLTNENTMWETQNRALQGSRTADNLEDISGVNEQASGLMGAGRSLLNMNFGDAAAKVGGALGPMAKGQSDATRQMIAQALMSKDPAKALAPMLAQQGRSDMARRLIEALLRNQVRPSVEGALNAN